MTNRLFCAALVTTIGCADPGASDRDPDRFGHTGNPVTVTAAKSPATPAGGGTWQPLHNQPTFSASLALLLTDGTVMVQDDSASDWWRLTPDATGSYLNGQWTQRGSMPSGYSPLYFASAVLPDGRVIAMGGEYNQNQQEFTTLGAIYDPIADTWQAVAAPSGWARIGDGQGIVLPNGTFMMADCCDDTMAEALLDATSLTWTETGTGKEDINDEEGWTLLPDDTLLTVDANNTAKPDESEQYTPSTGMWTSLGSTKAQLADIDTADNSHELGPAILRPDGTVFATGATGHNAVFDTGTMTWTAAPDFPKANGVQLDIADGPAALLPNGNVLMAASPGVFQNGTHFFEWDGAALTEVATTPNAAGNSSYVQNLLVLPTGEILLTDTSHDVELYEPVAASADVAGISAPVITSIPKLITSADPDPFIEKLVGVPPLTTLYASRSYKLSGRQLNGISQAVAYGDDGQAATSYPIIRITNQATGNVSYCRTHDGTSYSIAPDNESETTFDIPADADAGIGTLEVVANGTPSPGITINVR